MAEAAEEIGPVFGEEEDGIAIDAAVVDVVVLVREERDGAHGDFLIGDDIDLINFIKSQFHGLRLINRVFKKKLGFRNKWILCESVLRNRGFKKKPGFR